ncbi:MAG: GNAT family N-acetyltransferase [Planctomycetales bacterium]|nr:GNAT family N-acetyltransferase [Planctomycetales bacterium]
MTRRLGGHLSQPALPPGYRFVPWSESHLAAHSEAKYHSFRDEIDAELFSCFQSEEGCERLMRDISLKEGFLPQATWLVEYAAAPHKIEPCGTIQGMQLSRRVGGIQNIGITPLHRGRGLGRALISAALLGFQQAGLSAVHLEVTASNQAAYELYRKLGFRRAGAIYRAVEVDYSLG